MDIEALKALSEGGAWITLAGVLIWVVKKLLEEANQQRKRHALERLSQETRHRAERDAIFELHRKEREDWNAAENRRADRVADAIERGLRGKP